VPLIFVSGTFRGAERWIDDTKDVLRSKWNPLPVAINDFDDRVKLHKGFKSKLAWGDHHLRQARECGGIVMFWFARQTGRVQANCGIHFDNPYGANALYDLATTLMYKEHHPEALVVAGCHERYNRKNAVRDRLELSRTGVELIVGDLSDTLLQVKEMVRRPTFSYLP
jgi:hypothetical protein